MDTMILYMHAHTSENPSFVYNNDSQWIFILQLNVIKLSDIRPELPVCACEYTFLKHEGLTVTKVFIMLIRTVASTSLGEDDYCN